MTCLFRHKWNRCKCSKCGKIRDEQHDWNGCKCSKCEKMRDEQHDFDSDCECSICGKQHNFQKDSNYNIDKYEREDWNIVYLGTCSHCRTIMVEYKQDEIATDCSHPVPPYYGNDIYGEGFVCGCGKCETGTTKTIIQAQKSEITIHAIV